MGLTAGVQGKFGDILWALPIVRQWSEEQGQRVTFVIGGSYASLSPLLASQAYIESVVAIPEWVDGNNIPPGNRPDLIEAKYFIVLNPPIPTTEHLAFFTAKLGGMELRDVRLPFISVAPPVEAVKVDVTFGFSFEYAAHTKELVMGLLVEEFPDLVFRRVDQMPWVQAAQTIQAAKVHVGCRSALNVLAHGLGKNVVTVEPVACRRYPEFGCSFGRERLTESIEDAVVQLTNALREEGVEC